MIFQNRSVWIRVWVGLAIPVLLTAAGCIQAQRTGVEGNLMEAQAIRQELSAHPRAAQVQEELDQSARYQEKAEAYLSKSRQTTSVELKGVSRRYSDWAGQMAQLSLKKAREAKTRLEEPADSKSPPTAPPLAPATGRAEDAQGPPGPLTASGEEKQSGPPPLAEENQAGSGSGIVEKPLAEEQTASGPAPLKAPESSGGGEIIDPAREDLQGPRGPLKAEAAPQEQPAETITASAQPPSADQEAGHQAQEAVSPPETEPAASPKDLYGRALDLYRNGKYPASRRLFLAFLAQHPNHPLAVNSQYWIGETYYAEAEYVLALGAFEAVVDQYPNGSKVPDGMVKMGLSEMKLGRLSQARQALENCLAKYPSSEAAKVARRYLEQMN